MRNHYRCAKVQEEESLKRRNGTVVYHQEVTNVPHPHRSIAHPNMSSKFEPSHLFAFLHLTVCRTLGATEPREPLKFVAPRLTACNLGIRGVCCCNSIMDVGQYFAGSSSRYVSNIRRDLVPASHSQSLAPSLSLPVSRSQSLAPSLRVELSSILLPCQPWQCVLM